ncbi:MAG: flagellin [Armatimonadota bacterium]|jgi:flagellin
MGLRINLNTAALNAHRWLGVNDAALSKSIENLSSGYRINVAADDPAGLVISEGLRAQAQGLAQAMTNTGQAVNLIKTSEAAMQEVHNILRQMRDLAVHAANAGANDTAAIAADQAQIQSAIGSLDRISAQTQFGSKKLLDGTAGVMGQITGTTGAAAGTFVSGTDATKAGSYTITIDQAATQTNLVGSAAVAGTYAAGVLKLNGVGIDIAANSTAAQVAAAINGKTAQSGVSATEAAGVLTLQQTAYGSAHNVDTTGSTVDLTAAGLALAAGTLTQGVNVEAHTGEYATAVEGTGQLWTSTGGYASSGLSMLITGGAADDTMDVAVTAGTLTFQIGANAGQTVSAALQSTATTLLGVGATGLSAGGAQNVSQIDVSTTTGANDAILLLDQAISQVSTQRAGLGSLQRNVLESALNSLGVAQENVLASESSIRDTDMAAEMVSFTKYQILLQAGGAMLTQANQAPQVILQMLR